MKVRMGIKSSKRGYFSILFFFVFDVEKWIIATNPSPPICIKNDMLLKVVRNHTYLRSSLAPSLPYLQHFRPMVQHLFNAPPSFGNNILITHVIGNSSRICGRLNALITKQCVHQLSTCGFFGYAGYPSLFAMHPHRNLICRRDCVICSPGNVFARRCRLSAQ